MERRKDGKKKNKISHKLTFSCLFNITNTCINNYNGMFAQNVLFLEYSILKFLHSPDMTHNAGNGSFLCYYLE